MTHKGGSVKNAHKMAETLRLKIAPIESPIYVCTRSFLFCHDTLRDFCCYFKGHEAYNLQSLGWTTNMSDITHGPWENMVLSLNSFVNHPICPQKCCFFSFARWFMMTSFHSTSSGRPHAAILEWCHIMASTGQRSATSPYSLYTWDTPMSCCVPRKGRSKLTHQPLYVA